MVFIELFIAANYKRIKNNKFIKPIIQVAKQIDPDRTLKKLKRR